MGKKFIEEIGKTIEWDDNVMDESMAMQTAMGLVKQGQSSYGMDPAPAQAAPLKTNTKDLAKKIVADLYSGSSGTAAVQKENEKRVGPTESLGQTFGRIGKGIVAGASLPGQAIYSAMAKTPLDIALKQTNGGGATFADIPEMLEKNYDKYQSRVGKMKSEAPVAAAIGSIPQNVSMYAAGTGLLSQLPKLGALDATSKVGKLVEFIKTVTRGGITNAGIGQVQGAELEDIPQDFLMGAGGEIAGSGMQKAAEYLAKGGRKVGGRLMESVLKRPKNEIKAEMVKGDTLGEELYDRKIWGTQKSLAKQADEGLDAGEAALQETLKGAGSAPIKKTLVADELTKLKDFYSKIPGRESEVAQIQELMKKAYQGKSMTASEANQLKRSIYKLREKAYSKDLNPIQAESEMAMARGLKRGIENVAPETKAINKELSVFGRLNKSMQDLEAKGQKSSIIKIMSLLGSGALGAGVGFGTGDPKMGIALGLGAAGAGTPFGKSASARGIKALMDLIQSGSKNTRFLAPTLLSAAK